MLKVPCLAIVEQYKILDYLLHPAHMAMLWEKSLVINFFGIMIIKFIKCQDMLEKNLRHSGFQEDATRLLSNL